MANVPNKNTGDQLTASEYNQNNDEIKNYIQSAGIALSAADLTQITKAMSNYVAGADYYTDSGAVNAYVLNVIAPRLAATALADGFRARFSPSDTNTGASTVNVSGLGLKDIKKYGRTVDIEAGDLTQGRIVELTYSLSDDAFELNTIDNPVLVESVPLFNSFSGLKLSNNLVTPNTKLDIAPGTFKNRDTPAAATLNSTLIKQLNNTWVAGNDVGGRASGVTYSPNTWYHVFIIAKPDGTTDVGFDTSINATNLLSDAVGYTLFRRRGSVLTDSSSFILKFTMNENTFSWNAARFLALAIALYPIYSTVAIDAPKDVFTRASCAWQQDPTFATANADSSLHAKSTFMIDNFGPSGPSPYEVGYSILTDSPGESVVEARNRSTIIVDTASSIDVSNSNSQFTQTLAVIDYTELDL